MNLFLEMQCTVVYAKIATTNGPDGASAVGLATADCGAETGNSQSGAPATLVLVRQNARHLFEPRTPETEVTSSSSSEAVGSSLSELIVVQDECAGCLPLAAMLRPSHRAENQLSAGPAVPLPPPEAG